MNKSAVNDVTKLSLMNLQSRQHRCLQVLQYTNKETNVRLTGEIIADVSWVSWFSEISLSAVLFKTSIVI